MELNTKKNFHLAMKLQHLLFLTSSLFLGSFFNFFFGRSVFTTLLTLEAPIVNLFVTTKKTLNYLTINFLNRSKRLLLKPYCEVHAGRCVETKNYELKN